MRLQDSTSITLFYNEFPFFKVVQFDQLKLMHYAHWYKSLSSNLGASLNIMNQNRMLQVWSKSYSIFGTKLFFTNCKYLLIIYYNILAIDCILNAFPKLINSNLPRTKTLNHAKSQTVYFYSIVIDGLFFIQKFISAFQWTSVCRVYLVDLSVYLKCKNFRNFYFVLWLC